MDTNAAEEDSTFLFTSESVGEGHPDKLSDQISDAILDACLRVDPLARVAVEVAVKTGMVLAFGEVSCSQHPDYNEIIRAVVKRVGYDRPELGFDAASINVLTAIERQSPDIAQSLQAGQLESIGAGDQGLMFGYATDETEELMPLSLMLAHKLVKRVAELRRTKELTWLRPDCKAQVTIKYGKRADGGLLPISVHTIVLSCQHDPDVTLESLRYLLMEAVVKPIIDPNLLSPDTIYHIQPSGRFVIGGPQGDAGLTGRKIIVDTYGGWGAHGGGAFSGKDWSKVDRSGAYAARWIAKSMVASGLCKRCLVQVPNVDYTIY
jgi:S-adenosylmethionine synthetase